MTQERPIRDGIIAWLILVSVAGTLSYLGLEWFRQWFWLLLALPTIFLSYFLFGFVGQWIFRRFERGHHFDLHLAAMAGVLFIICLPLALIQAGTRIPIYLPGCIFFAVLQFAAIGYSVFRTRDYLVINEIFVIGATVFSNVVFVIVNKFR